MVESFRVSRTPIWPGNTTPAWYNPCPIVDADTVTMLVQPITGSDVYGGIHQSSSEDGGQTWTLPEPIAELRRIDHGDGLEEGWVCPVPQHHDRTGVTLALGTNVWYQDGVLTRSTTDRHIVQTVRDNAGRWTEPVRVEWADPRASGVYSCGHQQWLIRTDGSLLVPVMFTADTKRYSCSTLVCSFDGQTVQVEQSGTSLESPVGRGFMEPSITFSHGFHWMTMRAEDGRGHWSRSLDGLAWSPAQPWMWEDGTALDMSSTQQHWIARGDDLYLVYTRRTEDNADVVRWRSPLFVARVTVTGDHLRLDRSSEVAVLATGSERPSGGMPYFGNFQATRVTDTEWWVTDTEVAPQQGFRGATWLAKLTWDR